MWPWMTSEFIIYFMKNLLLQNVNIFFWFLQIQLMNECARKNLAKLAGTFIVIIYIDANPPKWSSSRVSKNLINIEIPNFYIFVSIKKKLFKAHTLNL